jgi:CBS domain-containing protein
LIASDLMTKTVITASADASVQAVARLLLDNGVGAVPVLDAAGAPIGMVSDGDLLGRRPEDYRREWWLEMLVDAAESRRPPSAPDTSRPVREVMSAPLISVEPDTPAPEIAAILQAHRIKRVPVIHNGELVGIVSRTDLLGVIEQLRQISRTKDDAGKGLLRFLESLVGGADLSHEELAPPPTAAEPATPPSVAAPHAAPALSADAFRDEVRAYEQEAIERAAAEKDAVRDERRRQAEAIRRQHVSDEAWRKLLDLAQAAAKHGEKEFLLHQFPCDLCSDGGRMIDVAEPGWETTLRGEPAELLARGRSELKPKGFGLSARIVSYVDGVLGDVGLFLTWGE